MNMPGRDELSALSSVSSVPCASIYLPTNRTGREDLGDPLRLKLLVDEAERQLLDRSFPRNEVHELLAPAYNLPTTAEWPRRGPGLAVLLSPGKTKLFSLDSPIESEAWGDNRHHVRPLVPFVLSSDRYLLLSLSESQVALYAGNSQSLERIEVPHLPRNIEEVLQIDEADRGSQTHSANSVMHGKQGAVFHGQGGKPESANRNLGEFVGRVAKVVDRQLQRERAPLVVAAVQRTAAVWQQLSTYGNPAAEPLLGSPDHLTPVQLHERSWPLVRQALQRDQVEAWSRLREAMGTAKAACNVSGVLRAVQEGRVATLFADCRQPRWGRLHGNAATTEEHAQAQPGDVDLIEEAIAQTLRHGGEVFAVPATQATKDNHDKKEYLLALLRY